MIVRSATVDRASFEAETGWTFKPEGACKGEVCIPLSEAPGDQIDARAIAETMGLPTVEDAEHGLLAIGPESVGSRALLSAEAPEVTLPDLNGNLVSLSDFKGQKVVVYAWAPY